MPEQAATAFEKLQTFTTDETILSAIEAEIQAASQPTAPEEVSTVEAVSEFATDEPAAEFTIDEVPPAVEQSPAPPAPAAETHAAPVLHHEPVTSEPVADEPVADELPVVAPPPGVLQEFVTDLESSLGDSFLPGTIAHEAEPAAEPISAQASKTEYDSRAELEPIGNAAPTTFGIPQGEPMGEFVADLEASLGDDFLKAAPVAESKPEPEPEAQPVEVHSPADPVPAQHWPAPTSAPAPPVSAPVAASAAAAASSGAPVHFAASRGSATATDRRTQAADFSHHSQRARCKVFSVRRRRRRRSRGDVRRAQTRSRSRRFHR